MADKLLSIKEAAARGISRLRKPIWANPLDHLAIDIINGEPGPWLHLFAPFNTECNGRDPVDFLWIVGPQKSDINSTEFAPYAGPLPDSAEYQADVARYTGCLAAPPLPETPEA